MPVTKLFGKHLPVPLALILLAVGCLVTSCEEIEDDPVPGVYNPDAVKGVKCVVSDESEWVIDWHKHFVFSYDIEVLEAVEGDLKFEINAVVPGIGAEEWAYICTFSSPMAGEKFSGQAKSDFVPAPGFYTCTAKLNDEVIRVFNVVCDIENIEVKDDRPADFEDFWASALDDLAKVPMTPELEINEGMSTRNFDVYNVTLHSAGDFTGDEVPIRGYLMEPKGVDNYPMAVIYQGYEQPSAINKPLSKPLLPARGTGALTIYTRGQGLNNREGRGTPYWKCIVSRLDSPKDYYYRGAYLDAARVIDFALSRERVDKSRIYASGGSQGGALALAAAALRPDNVRFALLSFPFMGHFPLYLQSAKWPADDIAGVCEKNGLAHYEALSTLAYFDTKNMATMVKCPVHLQLTLQDPTCPPWTQLPILNNLPKNTYRELTIGASLGHIGSDDFTREGNDFIDRMLK